MQQRMRRSGFIIGLLSLGLARRGSPDGQPGPGGH